MKRRKKGQEEMIGFVLIIVLVAVIALVFLAVSLRKQEEFEQNSEIENFLYSSMLYTTNCSKSAELAYNLQDLIKSCYKQEKCLNGEESCEILNKTLVDLFSKSWNFGEESVEKAYVFKIYQKDNVFVYLNQGKETNIKKSEKLPVSFVEGENIYAEMSVFY